MFVEGLEIDYEEGFKIFMETYFFYHKMNGDKIVLTEPSLETEKRR